jgi:hypothetical protein
MEEPLTIRDFAPNIHTRFHVSRPQIEDYELKLEEVTDHSNAQLEQFSLIFAGILSPCLPQGAYKLTHPQMPECELFLVPIGPDETGMRYQAIFSRFIRDGATDASGS